MGTIDGAGLVTDVRSATFVVAASNASANAIASADYKCDGTADEVEINAAILAVPTGNDVGGKVVLSGGTFNIAATILIEGIAETGFPWGFTLEGQGEMSTILAPATGFGGPILTVASDNPAGHADARWVTLRDFSIKDDRSEAVDGILLDHINCGVIENVWVEYLKGYALKSDRSQNWSVVNFSAVHCGDNTGGSEEPAINLHSQDATYYSLDFRFVNLVIEVPYYYGLYIKRYCDWIMVTNAKFHGSGPDNDYAPSLVYCDGIRSAFSNSEYTYAENSNIVLGSNSRDITISNNVINGWGEYNPATCIYSAGASIVITGNDLNFATSGEGIAIDDHGGSPGITIVGNQIWAEAARAAIHLEGGSVPLVTGNEIHDGAPSIVTERGACITGNGIRNSVTHAMNLSAIGSWGGVVSGNSITGPKHHGIYCRYGSWNIVGNWIQGASRTNNNTYDGINCSSADCMIVNNNVRDLEGAPTTKYGINVNGTNCLVQGNRVEASEMQTAAFLIGQTSTIARNNFGYTATGDIVVITKIIDHASITDGGGATGYMDFAETIPAGSIIKAVKCDFTEAFNSDATTTLTMMVGPQADLDAYNLTADPGEDAFNHTTDVFWGEGDCQVHIQTAAAAPRVTFTEDSDITDIISGGNAQGAVTVTITYMKA